MSAPSFPSFPPSFTSFPDLEEGSSSRRANEGGGSEVSRSKSKGRKHASKPKDGEIGKISHRKRDKQNRKDSHDHRTDEHGSRTKHRSSSKREARDRDSFLDDERLQRSSETRSNLFFSDHKGDSLNVVYGGLHSGDVPKYSFIHRTVLIYHIVGS